MAARESVAGLILESAFTSAFTVVTRWRILPFDRFPNAALLSGVHAPVLVIHGTADEVTSFRHGLRLHEAANEPKQALWVDGAGHNDLLHVAGNRYRQALVRFEATLRQRAPRSD